MIVRWGVRKLDNRLRFASFARTALSKVFPDHWTFMLGEIALYAFTFLVVSGVYLTLFFDPSTSDTVYTGSYPPLHGHSVSAAFSSTVQLSFDVRVGLLMRQAHHWAALIFIGAIVAHLLRIFFTAAYRRPRDINYLVGLTMLLLAILNGFTGYSLPDDLLSGTGLRIMTGVVLSIPIIGTWIYALVFGGEFPGDQLEHRLYSTHILVVPMLIGVLLAIHMAILIRQKHSQFPGRGRTESNVVGSKLYPQYLMRTLSLGCAVTAVLFALGGLIQINPIWLYGPFDPATVTGPAQPDWYIGWIEGSLRLFPPWEFRIGGYLVPNPFIPAVLLPAVTFIVLYLWPFAAARKRRDRGEHQLLEPPRNSPGRTAFGVAVLMFYVVLLAAGGDDVFADLTGTRIATWVAVFRVLLVALPVTCGVAAYVLARRLRRKPNTPMAEMSWDEFRGHEKAVDSAQPEPELPPPPGAARRGKRLEKTSSASEAAS